MPVQRIMEEVPAAEIVEWLAHFALSKEEHEKEMRKRGRR